MKKERVFRNAAVFAALTALAVFSAGPVYAGSDGKCWFKKGGAEAGGLEYKVYKKAAFLQKHAKDLALTDDQKKSLKDLENSLKKTLIEQDAKVKTVKVDIDAALYERPINVEAVNALIDQKYEAKKAASKSKVKALADLKNLLTDEQYAKMKELWKEKNDRKKD